MPCPITFDDLLLCSCRRSSKVGWQWGARFAVIQVSFGPRRQIEVGETSSSPPAHGPFPGVDRPPPPPCSPKTPGFASRIPQVTSNLARSMSGPAPLLPCDAHSSFQGQDDVCSRYHRLSKSGTDCGHGWEKNSGQGTCNPQQRTRKRGVATSPGESPVVVLRRGGQRSESHPRQNDDLRSRLSSLPTRPIVIPPLPAACIQAPCHGRLFMCMYVYACLDNLASAFVRNKIASQQAMRRPSLCLRLVANRIGD